MKQSIAQFVEDIISALLAGIGFAAIVIALLIGCAIIVNVRERFTPVGRLMRRRIDPYAVAFGDVPSDHFQKIDYPLTSAGVPSVRTRAATGVSIPSRLDAARIALSKNPQGGSR